MIDGGNRLEGEVVISGAKNSALPIIASTILNSNQVEITNCPDIHDVSIMFDILETLGCKVHRDKSSIRVDASNLNGFEIPENLMHEMRSSVIKADFA